MFCMSRLDKLVLFFGESCGPKSGLNSDLFFLKKILIFE